MYASACCGLDVSYSSSKATVAPTGTAVRPEEDRYLLQQQQINSSTNWDCQRVRPEGDRWLPHFPFPMMINKMHEKWRDLYTRGVPGK